MGHIAFKWEESTSLIDELTKPLRQVSIEFDSFGSPMAITLWRFNGTGLSINSEMHDVAERREIGVLCFTIVSFAASPKEELIDISSAFNAQLKAYKLIIQESGSSAESGIVLKSGDSELLVAPSARPYSLAIRGVLTSMPHIFEPEYQIDRYECVPFI